jgi:hypothetical protein
MCSKTVATLRAALIRRKSLYALVVVLALATAGASAAAGARPSRGSAKAATGKAHLAGTPVPPRFVGVNAGGPLLNGPGVNAASQFRQMVASGVQTVRTVFDWSEAQPYATWADVPAGQRSEFADVGGVPTNFSATDQIVALAAQRRLTVLPEVLYAPPWDQGSNPSGGAAPPARTAPYANFLTALIDRYGPHGSFWRTHHPKLAIRMWQVWNEPNINVYWPQPFAPTYVRLLKAAHDAIKRADPRATVVLAAITNVAWRDLGRIYAIRGARKLFDVAAVNAFTSTPKKVIRFLELVRRAMNRLGDHRKPLLYTEMSWPSATGQSVKHLDWDTTEAGQARKVAAVLPMLAAKRRSLGLKAFYYYTWMSEEYQGAFDDFNFAGLVRYQPNEKIIDKPALKAFKWAALKLEGCRKKGAVATRCIR